MEAQESRMPTAPADGVTGLLAERAVVPHMMVVDGRSIGQRHDLSYPRCRRQQPGVCIQTRHRARTYPTRFRSSKRAGPQFGLTPKKYQSGKTDRSGRISKI